VLTRQRKRPRIRLFSVIRGLSWVEAAVGFEPTYGALQAAIAPLEPLQTVGFQRVGVSR
jgi:hypothetical protein